MRTLIYTSVKDQFKGQEIAVELRKNPKDTASVRVVEFWQGETERCDAVVTDHEGVIKAYKDVGIDVKPFTQVKKVEKPVEFAPVEVQPQEVVEEPVKRGGRPRKVGE